jgi:hypothetical protein
MTIKRINRGRGHSYTIDGENTVGVTTALSVLDKPALPYAASKVLAERVLAMTADELHEVQSMRGELGVFELANTYRKQWSGRAARGTRVHRYAERLVAGEPVDLAEADEELLPEVEAAAQFMDTWRIRPLLVEPTVGDYTHRYAGSADLIAETGSGMRVLFDYKTNRRNRKGPSIYPETALQLTAYRFASHYVAADGTELPMAELGIEACKAVHLHPDGYDVYPLVSDARVFDTFLHALKVYRAMKELAPTWVQPIEANPVWADA